MHDVGAVARNKTDRRRIAQPLLTALDVHLGAHLANGLLLAVSGGPDSRALLEAVARWPRRFDGVIHVASVDHETRPSSRGEAEAVIARAKVLGFDGTVLSLPLSRAGAHDEASLREARYRTLTERAASLSLRLVVVAHHEGDVAEGALMSWLGHGGAGSAMANARPLLRGGAGAPPVATPVALVRPFLDVPRAVLREALGAMGITDVIVDPETASRRAQLRAGELTALGARRSQVEAALAHAARLRRDDDDALSALALAATDEGTVRSGPTAVVRRALRRALAEAAPGVDVRSSSAALEVVLRLMQRGTAGEVHLTGAIATVTPGDSAGAQRGGMRARIRARAHTVADSTASTHDGKGTKLSEAHPLLTLHTPPNFQHRPFEEEDT